VVDASILFSFFRQDSARRILLEQLRKRLQVGFPEFALEELTASQEKIAKHASVGKSEFLLALSLLRKVIEVVPKHEYEASLLPAREISPHLEDDPYFALALSLGAPIWSDEQAFRGQGKVKVYTTRELLELLKQ
jgi:predicted nucleic acid-binding protein